MIEQCPNCEQAVGSNFCGHCGQRTLEPRGSTWALVGDFLREFFSLDGKMVRTFLTLGQPGRLTERFFAGKRASYVNPIRLYLVSSLLFFIVVGIPTPDTSNMNVYLGKELIGRDAPLETASGRIQLLDLEESSWLRPLVPGIDEQLARLKQLPVQRIVDDYFGSLERMIPTALIVFVPFLALALKLLYVRHELFYVDHLVFALHSQSFLFLSLVLGRAANALGLAKVIPGLVTYMLVFLLVFPIYMLLALRTFYQQPWWKSVLKAAALALLYMVLIQPVLGATIAWVVFHL